MQPRAVFSVLGCVRLHRKILPLLLVIACSVWSQSLSVSVKLSLDRSQGPLDIDRIALGQGGLSADTMWEQREAEVRALHPRLIRLFVQEYFDLLPASGRYHFDTLDKSVDLILRTGATPLLSITFKPKVLFPKVDQDVVEPEDYQQWEDLIFALVRHYREPGGAGWYWEVGNVLLPGGGRPRGRRGGGVWGGEGEKGPRGGGGGGPPPPPPPPPPPYFF